MRNSQEDERKRREKEERIAREEEFLRSSLRGSRKLQALEETRGKAILAGPTGVVNAAYAGHDEHDERDEDDASERAFANAGLAWAALAQNNYLLNSGMQKIIGNSLLHHPFSSLDESTVILNQILIEITIKINFFILIQNSK